MSVEEIVDFSDLLKDKKFRMGDTVYVIPCITNAKAMELMAIGKKNFKTLKEDATPKETIGAINDAAEKVVESIDEIDDTMFDGLIDYIVAAIKHNDGSEVTMSHIKDTWPTKAIHKVMALINAQMSIEGEDKETAKN